MKNQKDSTVKQLIGTIGKLKKVSLPLVWHKRCPKTSFSRAFITTIDKATSLVIQWCHLGLHKPSSKKPLFQFTSNNLKKISFSMGFLLSNDSPLLYQQKTLHHYCISQVHWVGWCECSIFLGCQLQALVPVHMTQHHLGKTLCSLECCGTYQGLPVPSVMGHPHLQ